MRNYLTIALPQTPDWGEDLQEKARLYMEKYDSCTQSILAAFMEELKIDDPLLLRSAGAMHGGMVSSLTCGIHTSAMMILGLLLGRENVEEGVDGLMPIVHPAQELIQRLNARLGSHSCKEITGVDFTNRRQAQKYHLAGGKKRCERLVMEGVEEIAGFLQELDEQGGLFRAQSKKK
ncbi:MAG: C-GCAxxG-C-C family protein [Desulfocapsaceae bacterium]|nr:C-GCAxxG-C-C family protein [Desulfocapsaceae bacterium]